MKPIFNQKMNTATCVCGACHIELDTLIGTGLCHCTVCRKMTSSAFSMNTAVPASGFHLQSGQPKSYTITAPSGTEYFLHFCGDCGSALWIDGPALPDLKILKSGVLDGDEAMELEGIWPKAEQYTIRRPKWLCAVEGASQTDEQHISGREELEKS